MENYELKFATFGYILQQKTTFMEKVKIILLENGCNCDLLGDYLL